MKYQRLTPSGCKDKGVKKYEFVAKTQFLCGESHFEMFVESLGVPKKLNVKNEWKKMH